jgi:hypothetical protein
MQKQRKCGEKGVLEIGDASSRGDVRRERDASLENTSKIICQQQDCCESHQKRIMQVVNNSF